MTTLDVACAAEGAEYVAHSATMLHSLLAAHPGERVRIHYMHGPDIGRRDRRKLARMVRRDGGEISFLSVPDRRVRGLPTVGFTRKATWYRIFLPELRPHLDRILYLDSDLLVLESLVPLWQTDLTGNWVAAVTNVFQDDHLDRPAELALTGPQVYFNAGVLLLNLADMRDDGCTEALLTFAVEKAERLSWRDQDALNVVLGSRRLELHPRWNCMNSILLFPRAADVFGADAVAEARDDPAIRHFEGPGDNKPWHPDCERELRDLYFEHRRHTPWPGPAS
jgi:lipopolysaccharide biosynthesis glycosyltransferase